MGFEWLVEDEAAPQPAKPGSTPRSAKPAAAITLLIAVVGAALLWPHYRARGVLRAVEADVRTTVERELRAAREGDDEVFRSLTGVILAHEHRDPATGLIDPIPGVRAEPGVDIRVTAHPPSHRGGHVEAADIALTFQVADALGSGPYTENRRLRIDEEGAWQTVPDPNASRDSADEFRYHASSRLAGLERAESRDGVLRIWYRKAESGQAREWLSYLANEVSAYCEAQRTYGSSFRRRVRQGQRGEPSPCGLDVALVGAPGQIASVTHRETTYLVLPSPAALGDVDPAALDDVDHPTLDDLDAATLDDLDPATAAVFQRAAARYALAALAGVPPLADTWMERQDDPLADAASGRLGGAAALRLAILQHWLASRGLASRLDAVQPSNTAAEIDRNRRALWLMGLYSAAGPQGSGPDAGADAGPASARVDRAAEEAALAATLAAAEVIGAAGVAAVPTLLAAFHSGGDAVGWLSSALDNDDAERLAAWPNELAPFAGPRAVLAECVAGTGQFISHVVFFPGREVPIDLDAAACEIDEYVSSSRWAPGGDHLAVACSTNGQPRSRVTILETAGWTRLDQPAADPLTESPGGDPPPDAHGGNASTDAEVCCDSWSGDGARFSWIECCPLASRIAEVGAPATNVPAPRWLDDWTLMALERRDWGGWSVRPNDDDLAASALEEGLTVGGPASMTALVARRSLAWSPDGRRAAASQSSADGVTDPPAGGDGVTDPPAGGYAVGDILGDVLWRSEGLRPAWRPDGKRIAEVVRLDGTKVELVLRNADDGREIDRLEITPELVAEAGAAQNITADYIEPYDIAFSPDGTWLVVSGNWWMDGRSLESGGTFVAAWDAEGDIDRLRVVHGLQLPDGWWSDGTVRLAKSVAEGGVMLTAWDPATDTIADRLPLSNGPWSIQGDRVLRTEPLDDGSAHGYYEPGVLVLGELGSRDRWTYPNRMCRPGAWQPAAVP